MKLGKQILLEHSFDYNGEEVQLSLRTELSSGKYEEFVRKLKGVQEDENIKALSEVCPLLIQKWNLEDDAGIVPLEAEEIYNRVPLLVLIEVLQEAQGALNNGGVSKKSAG